MAREPFKGKSGSINRLEASGQNQFRHELPMMMMSIQYISLMQLSAHFKGVSNARIGEPTS